MALDMYRMHHVHRRVHTTRLYEGETWWVEASLIMGDTDASTLVVATVPGCRLADRCMGLAVRQYMTASECFVFCGVQPLPQSCKQAVCWTVSKHHASR